MKNLTITETLSELGRFKAEWVSDQNGSRYAAYLPDPSTLDLVRAAGATGVILGCAQDAPGTAFEATRVWA